MQYYKLNTKVELPGIEYFPCVSGFHVKNAFKEFDENNLKWNKILIDPPLYNHFSLISISKDGPNDCILLDFFLFAGPINPDLKSGCLISKKFKDLLCDYSLPVNTAFYPAKLLFKGRKYDYYILHTAFDYLNELNFEKSTWQYSNSKYGMLDTSQGFTELPSKVKNKSHYISLIERNGLESNLTLKEAYFNNFCDLMTINDISLFAISGRLKNAIESAEILPADLKPIEYIDFSFENIKQN